jgi:hypothetical protein
LGIDSLWLSDKADFREPLIVPIPRHSVLRLTGSTRCVTCVRKAFWIGQNISKFSGILEPAVGTCCIRPAQPDPRTATGMVQEF